MAAYSFGSIVANLSIFLIRIHLYTEIFPGMEETNVQ